jgi:predicted DNA-binding protein (MmcQ/YjbR family)
VFKVVGKMFALTGLEHIEPQVTLKCDPEYAIELREQYDCVKPGYHTNKKHWNTIYIENTVADSLIKTWIDHSYDEVIKGMTKKMRAELGL